MSTVDIGSARSSVLLLLKEICNILMHKYIPCKWQKVQIQHQMNNEKISEKNPNQYSCIALVEPILG